MTLPGSNHLFAKDFGPAAIAVNADGSAPIVLVCEHASKSIPPTLAGLGLDDEARVSHAAWDIGAENLARRLAFRLDAPLVLSNVSRLVYDCNRPPDSPAAIPEKSEVYEIPGNRGLDRAAREVRRKEVYEPFRDLLQLTLLGRDNPAIVTIHSFTPVYFGVRREVELGILHDEDDRLALAMFDAAPRLTGMKTAINEPYGPADGVTHTLKLALPRNLLNVMIEVRNDFLTDDRGAEKIARMLSKLVGAGLEACGHGIQRSKPARAERQAAENR